MATRRPKPSAERPPDIEIGATARADRVRFEDRPETEVEFHGDSIEENDSGSVRKNLPDEVEPGKTYRKVEIGWRAAAWIDDLVKDERAEKAIEDDTGES